MDMGASLNSRIFSAAVFLGFIVFSILTFLFLEAYQFAQTPADSLAPVRSFVVLPGDSFRRTAERLYQEKIIESAFKLRLYARLKGLDIRIKAGEYALSAAQTPAAILDAMAAGKVILYRVTVPEGYTLFQIADLFAQSGISDREDFIRTAADSETALRLGIEASTLEGYLFPDTYYFPKPSPSGSVIYTMVRNFRKAFKPQWEEAAARAGFTIHQIVTLASIIEKETGAPFERPLVASVFHNRLQKKMRLDSDPTVIYGIKNFDGDLTRKHLARRTPYNTYRMSGLPRGPIANPGTGSLEAAVYPAKTPFLYFVSKNDGAHLFSEDLQTHLSAVQAYQKKKETSP
jgi:UPF0755 protein